MKLISELGMIYPRETSKQKKRFGIYECQICKNHFKINTHSVKNRKSTKCINCANEAKKTHGLSKNPLLKVWTDQRRRCRNIKHQAYDDYGKRGIKFSEEFDDFSVWFNYIESLPNAHKENFTIDRINVNGHYEKGNLRWASKTTQARNTRKIYKGNSSGYRGVGYYKYSKK